MEQERELDQPGTASQQAQDREMAALMAAMRALNGPSGGSQPAGDPMQAAMGKLPGKGEWIKAAPGVAMVCGTMLILAFVTVLAALVITGSPTDSFFRLINLFLNALGAIATMATLTVALVHARRTMENRRIALANNAEAHEAADAARDAAQAAQGVGRQLNGDLDKRIVRAVRAALEAADDRSEEQDRRARRQDARGQDQDRRETSPE